VAEIILENVVKRYPDGALAVDNFNLNIADGEFIILVGPSGCGKSTTLNMVAGLEDITAGKLIIDGQVVNDKAPKDRDIAMVFQSYALYPHMDVESNLAFGLRRRGVARDEIDRRVREAADKLGLTPLLRRKPHALSGGQRQRVALGRAIVRDPKVFLFDEPLSNLDAALRVTTRNELIRQQKELGTTAIYVTHDQIEAMTMGDRICIMNQGGVVQIGSPLEVYRRPADTFVARFLGSPPMNLLAARLEPADGSLRLRLGEISLPLPEALWAPLGGRAGQTITAGVRPEDLYEAPPPGLQGRTATLPVRVDAVEPLGAETLLVLSFEGEELIARIGRDTALRAGDNVAILLDMGAIHLFDPTTGAALTGAR
jgi:multiple sugar transport system ATP-binding protein